ncbi:MAG: chromosome segregation ATPase [Oleiphilaceae bacterium]|jgi:chromosome segregation ATPase
MTNKNPKMEKRLSWIDINKQEQVQWIEQFIKLKAVMLYPNLYFPLVHTFYPEGYVSKFMECAKSWDEIAENREFCRRLKAAWSMWIKRKKNKKIKMVEGSYLISSNARNKLELLAKHENSSLSNIIEMLLTDADAITKRANETNNELREKLKLKDHELKSNQRRLETTEEELNISKQKLRSIEESLKISDQNLKAVKQRLEDTEKELSTSKKRLESSEESLKTTELELKSVQQRLENTEKESNNSEEKLEPIKESLKIDEEKLEYNASNGNKKTKKGQIDKFQRIARTALRNKKDS